MTGAWIYQPQPRRRRVSPRTIAKFIGLVTAEILRNLLS